ncbi:hypothetical protein P7D22_14085 [Lichenihabitans sp. Uapishka_5]|uniref:hypothetical protein n=1 Tax=Lichenihabitans sp. Uapishka_5 TaxID=3037302 RepID=UPI0029E81A42|nr:hypothetical protein [Lichenihabitans sp. Uapishka_5]MDX7952298.1 hypothetical protein [Lichenihabitans sp. Uapishka_5]
MLISLKIKALHGGGFQVEDPAGHWVVFNLDDLRSQSRTLRADMVEGTPELPPEKADLFVWSAFAAARGYAIEHGLIGDDRTSKC